MFDVHLKIRGTETSQSYSFILPGQSQQFVLNVVESINTFLSDSQSSSGQNQFCDLYLSLSQFTHIFPVENVKWVPPSNIFHKFDELINAVKQCEDTNISDTKQETMLDDLDQRDYDSDQHYEGYEDLTETEAVSSRRKNCNILSIEKVDLSGYSLPRGDDTVCPVCNKQFPSGVFLRKHYWKHSQSNQEKRRFYCKLCDVWLENKEAHNKHKKEHKQRWCSTCKTNFETAEELSVHDCRNPYTCTTCSKSFKRKQQLEAHQLVHSGLKQFGCEHCGKLFKQIGHLKAHVEEVHEVDQSSRSHICAQCGKGFPSVRKLTYHMTYTHAAKRIPRLTCNICGKSFSRAKLKPHVMRVHENNLPFACQYCGKGFVSKYYLDRHVGQTHKNLLNGAAAEHAILNNVSSQYKIS